MDDGRMDPALEALREEYNPPPEVPREAMWTVIRAGLPGQPDAEADVLSLDAARRRTQAPRRSMGWAVAAAAVLVLGIGIGRMTAPAGPAANVAESATSADAAVLRVAVVEHFDRSESFLALVRAEARAGALDPEMAAWARGLLSETRLFLDVSDRSEDPTVVDLMEDLELVLAQIVGVSEGGTVNAERVRTELDLALRGLEDREVMTRIQAVSGPTLAGT